MFAEVTDVSNSFTIGAGLAGSIGLVAWILKSALPALLRDFRDQLNKVQEDHTKELIAARVEFRQELAAFRIDNASIRKEFMDALSKMDATWNKTAEAVSELTHELRAMQACHTSEDRGPRRNIPATM
jgi:predicted metal-binding transcription factor (methanogenesis marker protein 9)